jgi:hypothetical protein
MGRLATTILGLYRHERPLFWTGILGLVLGAICFGGMAFHGLIVEPEGNLYKAATFDVAVGLFLLTLGLIVKVAGFTPVGQAIWRAVLIVLVLYSYGIETIQIFRGLDPRFSRVGSPLDQALGGLFFLAAVAIMICFIVLVARFFWKSTRGVGGPLVLALRYGAVASLLAFGVGIAMSALGTPDVGPSGNLLPLHAAGFHALQAVPLVAILLGWAKVEERAASKAVHAAGLTWIAACAGIAWQSGGGRSLLEPSAASALAAAALVGWGIVTARAVTVFLRKGAWPDELVVA